MGDGVCSDSRTEVGRRYNLAPLRANILGQVSEFAGLSVASLHPLTDLLAERGRAERGRYMWHTADRYVRFLAEFFLRRSNRSTVQRFLPAFVEAIPDFEALASADPAKVVELAWWAGLRRRVAALPDIASRFYSQESWTAAELLELPHIGAYAAQGIGLYVFGEATFPIDNNVRRVVGRYLGTRSDEELVSATEGLTEFAMRTYGIDGVRDVHRGVLALGWEACTSRPRCSLCPLAATCASRPVLAMGDTTSTA